ncbi:MAG: hypothetical protein ACREO3_01330 [Arenimonas sp.]
MRRAILSLGIFGAVLFGAAFVISYVNPLLVERAAREVVRIEIENRIGAKVEALTDSRIVVLAQKALGRTDVEIDATRRQIAGDVPRVVANVIADMLRADCECRRRLVEGAMEAEEARLTSLVQLRERLAGLVESAYASVSASLLREFRIFTASNAVAFALLAIITWFRRGASLQMALPALVLVGATAIVGGLYLFSQEWLHVIVFGEYVGLSYLAYLGVTALFLADIAFNRARVTSKLINAMLHVSGSGGLSIPC